MVSNNKFKKNALDCGMTIFWHKKVFIICNVQCSKFEKGVTLNGFLLILRDSCSSKIFEI